MLYPLTSGIFTNQQRCESVKVLETIVMVMVMVLVLVLVMVMVMVMRDADSVRPLNA